MKTILMALIITSLEFNAAFAEDAAASLPVPEPRIQIAILLDTSNSMDGLIDQAKTRLWRIVNEFVLAERDGARPVFEVALYEYGNSNIPQGEGYIRMVNPLTTDLDKVSENLFALRTKGGEEYCGKVIESAVNGLKWSNQPKDLKALYIAGNEPFTQGDVDYRKSCRAALTKGVMVNTIHCGGNEEGIRTMWKDGADIGEGVYANIDQNQVLAHIDAPQDAQILKLNSDLNDTYIPYGRVGALGKMRQSAQDSSMAAVAPAEAAERAVSKSSSYYNNEKWDLVDAVKSKRTKLGEVESIDLPENMKNMTPEEREAYVREQASKREEIQKKIGELNRARAQYIEAESKKQAAAGSDTFDAAMTRSLKQQAVELGYEFK